MEMETLIQTLTEAAEWHTQHADWIQDKIERNPKGIGVMEQAEQVIAHRKYAEDITVTISKLNGLDFSPVEEEMREFSENEKLFQSITGSHALAKACRDEFTYAARLRTGEVIRFSGADILNKDWVRLTLENMSDQPVENQIAFPGPRGLDVRISDIVWVMDAPEGS